CVTALGRVAPGSSRWVCRMISKSPSRRAQRKFALERLCSASARTPRQLPMQIHESDGAVSFLVRVQPRSTSDEICGAYGESIKIRLTAPPVDDRANESLLKFLAHHLKVPRSAVRIASGERSRTKRIEVRGITANDVRARLL